MKGIYVISQNDQPVYVGQSIRITERWQSHQKKYPKIEYDYRVIEETNDLDEREEYWIAKYDTYRNGDNVMPDAKHQPMRYAKWRKKVSEALKGRPSPTVGKKWYHLDNQEKIFDIGEEPEGWVRGRAPKMAKMLSEQSYAAGLLGGRPCRGAT